MIELRYIPLNIQKALGMKNEGTDYVESETVPTVQVGTSYRVPVGRTNGNTMFRRYMDNTLDIQYAADKIIDAIHTHVDGGILTNIEELALSVCFPSAFYFLDSEVALAMRDVNLQLSADEVRVIRHRVASQLLEEINWNSGLGGGSVPGRSVTRS